MAEGPRDLSHPVARTVGRERLLSRVEAALLHARPVSLRGRRGVGKTRLLAELQDRHVGPVQLLAGRDVAAGAAAAPTVRDRPDGDRSLLLLVDDAQRLPSIEVARLHALQGQPWCRVVTTVAIDDDVAGPSTLGAWWRAARWRSLEVSPLTRTATADLLIELLGGLAEPKLVHGVWRATGGHPVAIVELVRDAYELGCIVPRSDSWRQVAPLPIRRLTALVGEQLVGLSEGARHDLAVLALASPLPIRVAGRLLRPAAVKELEARGLVRFRSDRSGRYLSIVDAVHAEVVRAGVAGEERDRVLRALAEAFDRCGAVGGRHLDLAGWRLQVGGWSPEHLGDAAVRARCAGETGLAVALADAAMRDGAGSAAVRIRAMAGVELRAGQVADPAPWPQVDPATDAPAVGDPLLAAQALAIGAGRWVEAVEGLRASSISADPLRDAEAARGYAAVLAALGGRAGTAASLLADGDAGPLGEVAATLVAAAAGEADRTRQHAERVVACADGQDLVPLSSDLVRGHLLLVARDAPLEERIEDAAAEVDRALARLSAGTAWWYAVEGWLRWDAGQLGLARERLTSSLLACADADPTRLHPLLIADLAVLAASTGAVIEARWRLSQLGDDRAGNPAVAHRCAVAEALVAAQPSGGPVGTETAGILLGLATEAARDGRGRDAAWTCHLVVRSFAPASLEVPEQTLAGADALVVAHVAAWTSGDADALDGVARRFAAAGRRLAAAETARQAAAAGAGERSEAFAAALAAGLAGPRSPEVSDLAPVRISPRRRDAAVLAMQGCDDRRIAAELGLSVRTVENHLAKVYRQVGVAGRGELAELFDPAWPPFDRAAVGDR